ncbi:MAG TPA: hypothetical protein VK492_09005 [Chitinophagaceae bacterium]|nr:hypothetical protein [Chitinophagaceae bacterium]
MFVQKSAEPVLKNVTNILIWSIAKDVQRYADSVLIYAIQEFQHNGKQKSTKKQIKLNVEFAGVVKDPWEITKQYSTSVGISICQLLLILSSVIV